jgi:hypothetical protein
MLKSAAPILASLNEEETGKFYTEKLGVYFSFKLGGVI